MGFKDLTIKCVFQIEPGKFLKSKRHVCQSKSPNRSQYRGMPRVETYIMFLDDFDKPCEIEFCKQREVMYVSHQDGDFFFELSEPLLDRIDRQVTVYIIFLIVVVVVAAGIIIPTIPDIPLYITRRRRLIPSIIIFIRTTCSQVSSPSLFDETLDFVFELTDLVHQLIRLVSLERLAFRELVLQRADKVCFGGIVPRQVGLDLLFETAIVNVLICPLGIEGVLYIGVKWGMYCVVGNGHTFIRLPNFMVWACVRAREKKKVQSGKRRGVFIGRRVYRLGGLVVPVSYARQTCVPPQQRHYRVPYHNLNITNRFIYTYHIICITKKKLTICVLHRHIIIIMEQ